MSGDLYTPSDLTRESGGGEKEDAPWRRPFSRDYGRVLHSASFRRLQGKTQVFPGHESDFFRNRLTHSLEVAQIAEGIAERLNHVCEDLQSAPPEQQINPRLCAVASLMHDLGHPPFGHNGEKALDDAMHKHGGFEGNAQTLRIVSKLERKVRDQAGNAYGLDLTYRSLAAILKYDRPIPRSRRVGGKIVKGYYITESSLVKKIKSAIVPDRLDSKKPLKTVECQIMDIADDIAYSTYDLEDSMKAGFLTPADILSSNDTLLDQVATKVSSELGRKINRSDILDTFLDIFEGEHEGDENADALGFVDRFRAYRDLAASGYLRTQLSSDLVHKAINSVAIDYNKDVPALSLVSLTEEARTRIEILKQYTFVATIYSSRVKLPEFRGYEVVRGIFDALSGDRGSLLMPEDVRTLFDDSNDFDSQMRLISDFVAGMTDRYAMEFYGRLHSDSAQSMFKPV